MATNQGNISINVNVSGANALAFINRLNAALRLLNAQQTRGAAATGLVGAASTRALGSIRNVTGAVAGQVASTTKLIRNIVLLGGAYSGFRLFQRFISEGLRFNQLIETANLGIASIITATSEVRDPFGKIVTGTEALSGAVAIAAEQVNKLRIAGLQTAATTDELVQAFQSAAAAGIAAGLTMDEIRKVTVQVVQAAGTIGLPMQQLEQEVRSILQATIDRNSRVARVLNITNEQVRLMRDQGKLADYLNTRLKAFTIAGERAMETFAVMKSNLQDALQVLSGSAVEPLFDALGRAGQKALKAVFDFREARVSDQFQPIIEALAQFFQEFGARIEGSINTFLRKANEIGIWLDENRDKVREISDAFFDMVGAIGQAIVALGGMVSSTAKVATSGNALVTIFRSIEIVFKLVSFFVNKISETLLAISTNNNVRAFIAAVGALGLTVLALVNPVAAAVLGLKLLAAGLLLAAGRSEAARLAIDNVGAGMATNARLTSSYIRELASLDKALEVEKDEVERNRLLERRAELIEKLIEINPRWEAALKAEGRSREENIKAMERETHAQLILTKAKLDALAHQERQLSGTTPELEAARARLRELNKIKADIQKATPLDVQGAALGFVRPDRFKDEAERLRLEKEVGQAVVRRSEELTRVRAETVNLTAAEREYEKALLALQALGKVKSTLSDPDQANRATKAINDAKQALAAFLELRKAQQATEEEEQKALLERMLISYTEFHDNVNRIQQSSGDDQIAAWEKLRKSLTDQGDIAKADSEIAQLGERRARNAVKNARELAKSIVELSEQADQNHIRLLELQGNHVDAVRQRTISEMREFTTRINNEIPRLEDALERLKVEPEIETPEAREIREAMIREVEKALTSLPQAKIEIEAIINAAPAIAAMEAIDERLERRIQGTQREMQSIELARATRLATEEQLAERVVAVYENQLAIAEQAAVAIREALDQISDPAIRAEEAKRLEDLEQNILQVKIALEQARDAANFLRRALIESVQSGIETLLTSGIVNAFDTVISKNKEARNAVFATAEQIDRALEAQGIGIQDRTLQIQSFMDTMQDELDQSAGMLDVLKEAFRSFAAGVVQELQRVIAQMIAMRIIAAGLNLLSGGASGPTAVLGGFGGSTVGAASGGLIRGPGTETSDSVPVRLSRGEYVVRASAVRELGVDFLDMINYGRSVPKVRRYGYAEGGLVQAPVVTANTQSTEGSLTVGLEEGLVLRHLKTPAGQRALIKAIVENKRTFRSVLGL